MTAKIRTHHGVNEEKKQEIYKWLETPAKARISLTEVRRRLRVGAVKFREVRREWALQKKLHKPLSTEDPDYILASKIKAMDTAVFNAATIGRVAMMAELWYKRHGLLTDKREVTHKIDGSFFAKAAREAERELRESGKGVVEVQNLSTKPPELEEGRDDTKKGL